MERVTVAGLQVGEPLYDFVETEALPVAGVDSATYWEALASIVADFSAGNAELLEDRARIQAAIDDWHRARAGRPHDRQEYRAFLSEIGYLVPVGPAFEIDTDGVDAEIAEVCGPQLVVPVMNARYALNAANARWGSLYDALYGTDAVGDPPEPGPYDPARGARVIDWARRFLDDVVPLESGSHVGSTAYEVVDGALVVTVAGGERVGLAAPDQFAGTIDANVVLVNHGLHIELVIDPTHPVGVDDGAGIADVVIESAVTTIMDCEDSVAAVDAADKTLAYRNWLGLMTGALTTEVTKGDETFTRRLAGDRTLVAPDGTTATLRGRSLMLVRNVGHLMTTPAVLDADGNEIYEGLLDAAMTVLCAMGDLAAGDAARNSRTGSVYVVKPKMHGPEEVAFCDAVFSRVEELFGLAPNTVKIGIMDEERRTTVNLAECIRAARSRVAFINTGFLDRTGDEIHTSMEAGPMVAKSRMKAERWIGAYEDWNVDVGLACGLAGRAQIGKGMWAAPDHMAQMMRDKIAHPMAGANCAWVPSPTAATLHATHYHRVDVFARQRAIAAEGPRASLEDLLEIPVDADAAWTDDEIQAELDNNAQGILGYVVRWVDHGVGCSKVPDIDDVALMEDRATCRISSQHMANWLRHGVVDADRVRATFERMAAKVDAQNADDPAYRPLVDDPDGPAYRSALNLVLHGTESPSGYTEPILHAGRAEAKRRDRP